MINLNPMREELYRIEIARRDPDKTPWYLPFFLLPIIGLLGIATGMVCVYYDLKPFGIL